MGQIDFRNGEIRFLKENAERSNMMDEQSNKRKARTPMAAQLHRHLRFRAQQLGQRSSFVFHRENAPHAHVKSVDRGFEKAVEMAGLSGITPHSLRHTRASLMIRGGVHMKVISEILDMSIETLNKVYAHVSRDELNAMSSWMGRTATMRSQNVRTTLEPIRKNARKFARS